MQFPKKSAYLLCQISKELQFHSLLG